MPVSFFMHAKNSLVYVHAPKETGIFTDHSTLEFDILLSPKSPSKISRRVYDYGRGDFNALRSPLLNLNLSGLISYYDDPKHDWKLWKEAFLTTVTDHIPTKVTHTGS